MPVKVIKAARKHPGKKLTTNAQKKAPPAQTSSEIDEALEKLDEEGVVAALRGAKEGISDLLVNTDRALSVKLAVVYGAGLIVEDDNDEWDLLCAAEEWADHPKLKPKRSDPFRAALRLAVGFDGKKADSTVHRYYKALNPLFIEKVPAKEIPDRIREAGGIEKMRQASARSVEVSGTQDIMLTLYGLAKTTTFKAWIRVDPLNEGVAKTTITKLKPLTKK